LLQSLYAASSGMEASQTQFNAISNDLANMDTPGYQATDVGFQDLLYSKGGESTGTTVATGAGAEATIVGRDQTQGALQNTGRALDVAIEGPGYLQVRRPDGSTGLTRNGSLQVDGAGHVTTQDGQLLSPPLTIPGSASGKNVSIATDGTVSAGGRKIGKIQIVDVPAPNQLLPDGDSTFSPTTASGAPRPATGSKLQQGALEGSNVDVNAVMSQMINAERTYQMAGQAIQYQDQMLQIANGIKPQ
jgi:flagellar basal-body rod protein FlgG